MDNTKKLSFQLLMLITTPKLAEEAAEMFKQGALPLQYRFSAEGTASSEIMDILGLGSIDKCVLISMLPKHLSNIIMDKLLHDLHLNRANTGIAFTIPLNGANTLILRILDQNTNQEVLAAGAKGGTVICCRRIGNDDVMNFWGLSVQDEKEIVLILTESENKVNLMKCIGEHCGMHSEAQGIVISLPVDSVVGL